MSKARKPAAGAAQPAARSLVDGAGNPVALGPEIGRGGEGAVYGTADEAVVAKVYADPGKARPGKLAAMLPMARRMDAFAAWPRDVLRDAGTGRVVGFTMRRAGGLHDIHDLYNVKSRRSRFPKADWRFLVHVAANLCRAFAAVHEAGCVVGDVNHGGVRVAEDGTVTLIDCDSFQVPGESGPHRCEVGVDTFTPPELQGVTFADIDRTQDHDAFGLSVLTFQLLFLGRHPYIGVYSGHGEMDPARAVRENRYAFGRDAAASQMRPPPGSVPADTAGPEVAALFERAFAPDAPARGRPSAREWLDALVRLEASLVRCTADDAHWHAPGMECPWCRLERGSGVQLFPVHVRRLANSLFDMAGWRAALSRIREPGPLPRPDDPPAAPRTGIGRWRRAGKAAGALLFLSLCALAYVLGSWLVLLGAFVAGPLIRAALRRRPSVRRLRARKAEAERAYDAAWQEWERRAHPGRYYDLVSALRARAGEWEALPAEHERRMRRLTSNLEVDQRARWLDRFPIDGAKVEGIGPIRVQALESFGISTAADVEEEAVLNVPGFGPKRYEALRLWRAGVEAGFRFDPKRGVDPADVARAEAESLRRREAIERDLSAGLAELKSMSRRIEAARRDLLPGVEAAAAERAQARADYAAAS